MQKRIEGTKMNKKEIIKKLEKELPDLDVEYSLIYDADKGEYIISIQEAKTI